MLFFSKFIISDFIKIENVTCTSSYGRYLKQEDANRICAADPKCRFVLRYHCRYPSIFPNSKLCGYESTLIASNSTCVYQKEDYKSSRSVVHSNASNSQGNDIILNQTLIPFKKLLIFTSFRTILILPKADTIHCTPWPEYASNCDYKLGLEWELLDDNTFETSECESLCIQHASVDGCCRIDDGRTCYWRAGSIAKMDKPKDSGLIAVTCVTQVSGEYYLTLSK